MNEMKIVNFLKIHYPIFTILLNPFKWIQFFKNALSSFHISILLNPFKWIQFFKNTLSSFHISILLNPFKWIVYFTL